MREQPVHEVEGDAQHDAGEHLVAGAAGPDLQVGEGQRQRHHHDHRERIDDLLPEGDLVLAGVLRVFAQMPDVAVQVQPGHAVWLHEQHAEDLGPELGLPVQRGRGGPPGAHGRRQARGRHVGEADLLDLAQLPAVAPPPARAARFQQAAQAHLRIELEDPHVAQGAVGKQLPDVHEAHQVHLARRVAGGVLDPQAGAELPGDRAADRRQPQLLPEALGRRRQHLAHQRGEHRQGEPHAGHHPQGAPAAQARGAHGGVLGVRSQLRERVDAADQRRDRHQLVHVGRQAEQDEGHRVLEPVAAPADVLELVDQVEEGKEREKAQEHEGHRGDDLAPEIAADQQHQPALRGRASAKRANRLPRGSRTLRQNSSAINAASAAWTAQTPIPKPIRSCATQACDTDIRLL